jgi:pantoate--beta-alanine ligase
MVQQDRDRWPGLKIVPHPTVREPDGLAMSSRNAYLKPRHRDRALGLFRALRAAQHRRRETESIESLENTMRSILIEHGLQIDYAVLRDARTLLPPTEASAPLRALIAAHLEGVRLIDNLPITA